MDKHLRKAVIGLVVGTTGTIFAWSGYRGLGILLGLIGWGIMAYGINGGILEMIEQRRNKNVVTNENELDD